MKHITLNELRSLIREIWDAGEQAENGHTPLDLDIQWTDDNRVEIWDSQNRETWDAQDAVPQIKEWLECWYPQEITAPLAGLTLVR